MTVNCYLQALGKVNKHGDSVPWKLYASNLARQLSLCRSLQYPDPDPFLERIITGAKKWVRHSNVRRSKRCFGLG